MEPVSILLVDDEPSLIRLLHSYLTKLGYQVECCSNVTSTLERFPQEVGKFRLLLADLTLPDGSGDAMALQIARQDASLKVLLCSGYPYDLECIPPELRSRFGSLQKPFLPQKLAEAIAKLLNLRWPA